VAWLTRAPAKINLDLRLRGLRPDGYHEVSTLLQAVGLADTLMLQAATGPFVLSCDGAGVPVDDTNLAWRGAAAMAAHLGVGLDGWRVHLRKAVPAEAGLGGGSADAAAAARLLAHAVGAAVPAGVIADVLRPLGADVAFFAHGGTVKAEGIGDQLEPWPDAPAATVLLVRPAFGVSTATAYRWADEDGATGVSADRDRATVPGSHSQRAGRHAWQGPAAPVSTAGWTTMWPSMANDLQAPVAARHPEIAAIVARLYAANAWLAAMSGSGSACFGLFAPGDDTRALDRGWPPGTRVWRTALLDAAGYRRLTEVTPCADLFG